MNNLRVRHAIQPSYRWFLPSGTSCNEALHAEINSLSRSINAMRATLAMKLMFFRHIKLLLHYLSVQYPLSHVVSASMLLSRSLHTSLWMIGQHGVPSNCRILSLRKPCCLYLPPTSTRPTWSVNMC